MQDEQEIIEQCKDGNNRAFEVLVNEYGTKIYNFCKQYARSHEETDDIYQESIFKAWKKIKTFKAGNKFLPWLYRITRNTALDHIKKRRDITFSKMNSAAPYDDDNLNDDFENNIEDTSPLPDEIFEKEELKYTVNNALHKINPDERAILMLHYAQELTFEEISDIVDKPMNTVKSMHRRAILKVREYLLHQK